MHLWPIALRRRHTCPFRRSHGRNGGAGGPSCACPLGAGWKWCHERFVRAVLCTSGLGLSLMIAAFGSIRWKVLLPRDGRVFWALFCCASAAPAMSRRVVRGAPLGRHPTPPHPLFPAVQVQTMIHKYRDTGNRLTIYKTGGSVLDTPCVFSFPLSCSRITSSCVS